MLRGRPAPAMMLASIFAMATSSIVHAARPDVRVMSCAQVRTMVASRGAVVMTTGQHTYDRIVAGIGLCGGDEELELKRVPAKDNPRCLAGYICRTRINDDRFPILRF
ncbi:MAG: hypothetical protein WBO55_05580 [Rhizobiaceae bacterium]